LTSRTVLVLTTNVGSRKAGAEGISFAQPTDEVQFEQQAIDKATAELRRAFPTDLIDQVDDVILFRNLNGKDAVAILEMRIQDVIQVRGIRVSLGQNLVQEVLNDHSSGKSNPAIIREWMASIEDTLSHEFLNGRAAPGSVMLVDAADKDRRLSVSYERS